MVSFLLVSVLNAVEPILFVFFLQIFFSFFKTLIGKQVVVELKNDVAIRGTLHSVDQYLNVKLVDVEVVDAERYPQLVSFVSFVSFAFSHFCVCVCVSCSGFFEKYVHSWLCGQIHSSRPFRCRHSPFAGSSVEGIFVEFSIKK